MTFPNDKASVDFAVARRPSSDLIILKCHESYSTMSTNYAGRFEVGQKIV